MHAISDQLILRIRQERRREQDEIKGGKRGKGEGERRRGGNTKSCRPSSANSATTNAEDVISKGE